MSLQDESFPADSLLELDSTQYDSSSQNSPAAFVFPATPIDFKRSLTFTGRNVNGSGSGNGSGCGSDVNVGINLDAVVLSKSTTAASTKPTTVGGFLSTTPTDVSSSTNSTSSSTSMACNSSPINRNEQLTENGAGISISTNSSGSEPNTSSGSSSKQNSDTSGKTTVSDPTGLAGEKRHNISSLNKSNSLGREKDTKVKASSFQDIHTMRTQRRYKHVQSKVGQYIANFKAEEEQRLTRQRQEKLANFQKRFSMPETIRFEVPPISTSTSTATVTATTSSSLSTLNNRHQMFDVVAMNDQRLNQSIPNISGDIEKILDYHHPHHRPPTSTTTKAAVTKISTDFVDKSTYADLVTERDQLLSYSEHLETIIKQKQSDNCRLKRNVEYLRIELMNSQDKVKQLSAEKQKQRFSGSAGNISFGSGNNLFNDALPHHQTVHQLTPMQQSSLWSGYGTGYNNSYGNNKIFNGSSGQLANNAWTETGTAVIVPFGGISSSSLLTSSSATKSTQTEFFTPPAAKQPPQLLPMAPLHIRVPRNNFSNYQYPLDTPIGNKICIVFVGNNNNDDDDSNITGAKPIALSFNQSEIDGTTGELSLVALQNGNDNSSNIATATIHDAGHTLEHQQMYNNRQQQQQQQEQEQEQGNNSSNGPSSSNDSAIDIEAKELQIESPPAEYNRRSIESVVATALAAANDIQMNTSTTKKQQKQTRPRHSLLFASEMASIMTTTATASSVCATATSSTTNAIAHAGHVNAIASANAGVTTADDATLAMSAITVESKKLPITSIQEELSSLSPTSTLTLSSTFGLDAAEQQQEEEGKQQQWQQRVNQNRNFISSLFIRKERSKKMFLDNYDDVDDDDATAIAFSTLATMNTTNRKRKTLRQRWLKFFKPCRRCDDISQSLEMSTVYNNNNNNTTNNNNNHSNSNCNNNETYGEIPLLRNITNLVSKTHRPNNERKRRQRHQRNLE